MKKIIITTIVALGFLLNALSAQEFIVLENGQDQQINGMLVGFSAVLKETKKEADLYKITVTITNQGNDYLRIFESAPDVYIEKPEHAIAFFQFTNATGKALSATDARLFPHPLSVKVSYACKKCPPPTKKDEDPNEYYTKMAIVGTQFVGGATLNKVLNIRVPTGEEPKVRVMVY
ncbi:MAG: hypothetical protein JW729_03700 [Bacteroidales bacterium]|nr:hypothetical protein [Bacteroidales bacterium]